jgi:hypothetical protein
VKRGLQNGELYSQRCLQLALLLLSYCHRHQWKEKQSEKKKLLQFLKQNVAKRSKKKKGKGR